MKRFSLTAMLVPLLLLALLQGCSESKDKKAGTAEKPAPQPEIEEIVTVDDIHPGTRYDCISKLDMTADKRAWCRGWSSWQQSASLQDGDAEGEGEYIEAYRLGALDAQQAKTPAMENLQSRPVAAEGYEAGYVDVLDAIGIVEYDCSDGDESDNEYRDRWCEAAAAYSTSGAGTPANIILRSTFINGFMAGRAIALTIPTSMESLFGNEGGEQVEGADKHAIDEPEDDAPKAVKVFYRGFNDGYQAMLNTVRESVNQVMEQMQMPLEDGMPPGMDGMPMDGMPGFDGMPPMPMDDQ